MKRKIIRDNKTGRAVGTEQKWSGKEMLFHLRQLANGMDHTPTFDEYKSHYLMIRDSELIGTIPHPKTIQERFGSWAKACIATGYYPNKWYDPHWLVSEVERFIVQYGHVPSTNEFRYTKGYPGTKAYKRVFGSFNQCLVTMGYTPVVVRKKSAFSKNAVAKDGHICDSHEECFVDNWMTDHGVAHSIQPLYPRHITWNPKGFIRADFLVEGSFVEYAGLIGKPYYRERLARKKSLAEVSGIDLVIVYPTDLSHIETILGRFEKKRNTLQPDMASGMV